MDDNTSQVEQAYAQATAYGKDLARLYAIEKTRRKELETTTQKLQALFDAVPNGLAVVDRDLNLIEANPRFLAMFEQTATCIGQPLAQLLPVDLLQERMQSMSTSLNEMDGVEIEIRTPVTRILLINFSPLSDERGWVLILHDLTEHKRLEGLKGEFINIAAHELRTPLAGVIGFVSILQDELQDSDNPMAVDLMRLILRSTERLKGIIDELVDFAATNRRTTDSLHIINVDLTRIIYKAMTLLQPRIEAKNLTCQLEIPDETLFVRGDQFILSEVIYHLLENAVKFNKAQGKIIVRAYSSATSPGAVEKTAFIEIADSGIGIPKTELNKVFDKFYQVEEHQTRAFDGLGLGLTMARDGVERHQGHLTVTSQLGQGTLFRITLPPITQLSESMPIDNQMNVAHRQTLAYAKDMARAVVSQKKMSQKMKQIQVLSVDLGEKLTELSNVEPDSKNHADIFSQVQNIVQELAELSA